jgi:hypothetical protein
VGRQTSADGAEDSVVSDYHIPPPLCSFGHQCPYQTEELVAGKFPARKRSLSYPTYTEEVVRFAWAQFSAVVT